MYVEQEPTCEETIESFTQQNCTKSAIQYVQIPTLACLPFTHYSNCFQLNNSMSLCQEGRPNGYLGPASLHQIPTPDARLQDHSSAHQIPPLNPPLDHAPKHTPDLALPHQVEPTGSSGSKSGAEISSTVVPSALSHCSFEYAGFTFYKSIKLNRGTDNLISVVF